MTQPKQPEKYQQPEKYLAPSGCRYLFGGGRTDAALDHGLEKVLAIAAGRSVAEQDLILQHMNASSSPWTGTR